MRAIVATKLPLPHLDGPRRGVPFDPARVLLVPQRLRQNDFLDRGFWTVSRLVGGVSKKEDFLGDLEWREPCCAAHQRLCPRLSPRPNPQLQLDALDTLGYDAIFREKMSGGRDDRPEFKRALAEVTEGDTFLFWKSDRFGRSAAHVLTVVKELRARGVKIVSLTESFDLETKEGRFMFAVLAAAAEYELELRAEVRPRASRPRAGFCQAKSGWAAPACSAPAERAALRDLVANGKSVTEAARTLKIGRSTA